METLKTDMEKLKNIVQQMKNKDEKVRNINEKLNKVDKSIDKLVKFKLNEQKIKIVEKREREFNFVLFGAPESAKDDAKKRKEDDNNFVKNVISEMNIRPEEYEAFTRLGAKRTNRSKFRPLRFRVETVLVF